MDEYFEYESIVFALGGETVCPICETGVLIPDDISDVTELSCDVCDTVFIAGHESSIEKE